MKVIKTKTIIDAFINNLICQYEYDVDYHSSSIDTDNFKILITINATSPTHVKYEKNSETALIKVGESKTVGDTVDHITITAKKDLKDIEVFTK